LAVGVRAQSLDCLAETHGLASGRGWARHARFKSGTSHVSPETGEANAQIVADMSRGDALAKVLEAVAGLLRAHPGQVLNLVRQLRVPGEDIVHGLAMRSARITGGIRTMISCSVVHTRAGTHSAAHAARMSVLGQSGCTPKCASQGDCKNL